MTKLERQVTELPCPKCERGIEVTYYDIFGRREAKCKRCGSMYKFKPLDASQVKSAISNLEKAQEKLGDAIQKALKGADVLLKR